MKIYGWKTRSLFVDDLVNYMTGIEDERTFKSTYTPTWYIDTEGTRLTLKADYSWTKKEKRIPPTEDKIDEKKLSEII